MKWPDTVAHIAGYLFLAVAIYAMADCTARSNQGAARCGCAR